MQIHIHLQKLEKPYILSVSDVAFEHLLNPLAYSLKQVENYQDLEIFFPTLVQVLVLVINKVSTSTEENIAECTISAINSAIKIFLKGHQHSQNKVSTN